MSSISTDICIIGGGVVGLTLAIALGQKSFKVILLDSKTKDSFLEIDSSIDYDSRIYALNQSSMTLLNKVELMTALLKERHTICNKMILWDKATQQDLQLDGNLYSNSALMYIFEQKTLLKILYNELQRYSNIHFFHSTEIANVDEHGSVFLNDNQSITAKLIIGADGANSVVRGSIADFKLKTKSYQQTALVANVHHMQPHNQIAYQCFDSTEPLAFLPLSHPNHSSIVWSCSSERAQELLQLPEEFFVRKLAKQLNMRLGNINLLNKVVSFPLVKSHVKPYFKNRVVLVGDAAHTIHPMAGLGLNLGLMDVSSLVDLLANTSKKQRDIGAYATLRQYERRRRTHNELMIKLLDALKFGFGLRLPFSWANNNFWIKKTMLNIAQGDYTIPSILK